MVNPIKNIHGERLDFTFHPGAPGAAQLVIIGHGVTGHKDRPFLVALAEGLAGAGIPVLRISWSGNAGSEGRFADCTISKEVADLGAVLDACAGYTVTYVGHSMGGAVGVFLAARIFDWSARYDWVWLAAFGLAILAGLMAFAIRENRDRDLVPAIA